MDHEEPVTVYTLTDRLEAEIIQTAMRAEGIPCEIGGASQAGLSGVMEISILTRAEDADKARALLAEHEKRRDAREKMEKRSDSDDQ